MFGLRFSFICLNRLFETVLKIHPVNIRYLPNLHFLKRKWLITNILKHTRNTNNSGISFYKQIYNEKHRTKTAKMLDTQNCLQNHIKNAKATKFLLQSSFYTSKGKGNTCKFYLSMTFGLSFIISFVAPTRSSTSYAYLVTKTGTVTLTFTDLQLSRVSTNLDTVW